MWCSIPFLEQAPRASLPRCGDATASVSKLSQLTSISPCNAWSDHVKQHRYPSSNSKRGNVTLEDAIDKVMGRPTQSSLRLAPLADYAIEQLEYHGLPGVKGGSSGELRFKGLARSKDWDVAYDFAGKPRLLLSLKSIWSNAGGSIPNRIDDLIGEAANVQQMSPEIVIGYLLLFDFSKSIS